MNLQQIFDTLIYGKGTAKRKDYFFTLSVESMNKHKDLGYKKIELIERTYYVTYKGVTILVLKDYNSTDYKPTVIFKMNEKMIKSNEFNPLIKKTIDRICDYVMIPYSQYKLKYENKLNEKE